MEIYGISVTGRFEATGSTEVVNISASYAVSADTASIVLSTVESASYALTSSYAENAGTNYWTASGADITRMGNIGIGTTSPDKNLHIKGAGDANLVFETVGEDVKGYFAHLGNTIQLSINRDIAGAFSDTGQAASAMNFVSLPSDSFISFYTHNTNNTNPLLRMEIDKNGYIYVPQRIGIGTPNPGDSLDVASGQIRGPNGSVVAGNAPGITFTSYTDTGIAANEQNLVFWESGVIALNLADVAKEFRVPADYKYSFSEATNNNAASDTRFYRGAAGILATDGNFISTGSITASQGFFGTASYATQALTASYVSGSSSVSASYSLSSSYSDFAVTASYVSGSSSVSSSYALSSSYSDFAVTASYVSGSSNVSASYALSSSYSVTASYAETANILPFAGGFVTQSFTSEPTWSFSHNLGSQYISFEIYNSDDEVMVPSKIIAVDTNNADIYFPVSKSGIAIATFGGNVTTASYALTVDFVGGTGLSIETTTISSLIALETASITGTFADDDYLVTIIESANQGGIDENTVLMCHFNGTASDASNNHIVTASSSPPTFDGVFKLGSDSAYFDNQATTYYTLPTSTDWNFSGSSFTWEFWLNPSDVTSHYQPIFAQYSDNDNRNYMLIDTLDKISVVEIVGGTVVTNISSSVFSSYEIGIWYHIAVVKGYNGDPLNWAFFINGVLDVTQSAVQTWTNLDIRPSIGATFFNTWGSANTYAHGYYDEYRLSTVARYTASSFVVPDREFATESIVRQVASIGDTAPNDYTVVKNSDTELIMTKNRYGASTDIKFIVGREGGLIPSASYAVTASYAENSAGGTDFLVVQVFS